MYRALYRRWRPRRFADVVGQQLITETLQQQIIHGKVGHAYLFTGSRGTGKTTCAQLFARAVNCERRSGAEPCGECEVCRGLADGGILDVEEIDAASNNGVDDVRLLREETAYRPGRCRFRVYIIDEVHMLSASAFNALLKTLEEPPSHVIFILATTEIHKVPATILSRCQRFDFARIPAAEAAKRLLYIAGEESIELTAGAADLIARIAGGSMRDANSLLDTCSGLGRAVDEALVRSMAGVADKRYLFELSGAVAAGDLSGALGITARLSGQSADARRVCEELVLHYRNILLALAAPDGALLDDVPRDDAESYVQAAPGVGEAFTVRAIRRLAEAMDRMGRSPEPRVELELALFDLCERTVPAEMVPAATQAPEGAAPSAPAPKREPPVQVRMADSPIPPAPNTREGEAAAVFEPWPQVVQRMAAVNRMLHSYMKSSSAYLAGKRVLIDADEMFITHMRETEGASETIKNVIEEITGRRYAIGPYTAAAGGAAAPGGAQDTLSRWRGMGLEIRQE